MRMARHTPPRLFEDPRQMILPLLIELENQSPANEPAVTVVKTTPAAEPVTEAMSSADIDQWTDEELEHLHEFLLEQSLEQALNPRSSVSTRVDVLSWVDEVTPYKKPMRAFSFDACCSLSGYSSENMREFLHCEMKERGIHPEQNS